MLRKSVFYLLALFSALQSFSSQSAQPSAQTMKPVYIKGNGFEGVILDWKEVVGGITSSTSPGWNPGKKDIAQMEKGLARYLKAERKIYNKNLYESLGSKPYIPSPLPIPLAKYKRQYFGLTENGHKVIYVNLFCQYADHWKEKPVVVYDGGDCYIQMKYDVQTGKFYGYTENGAA